jgi:hypothetical protein
MSNEGDIVPRFWNKDIVSFNEEGFEGWMIFGLLGFFNFLYYSDQFAYRYTTSNIFLPDDTKGGTGSSFFAQLGFKSLWGIGMWVRIFLNWASWFVVLFVWCLTLIPDYHIAEVWLFNIGAYFMGTLHLIRTAFLIVVWTISVGIYDNYKSYYALYDYFEAQDGWGHRTPHERYLKVTGDLIAEEHRFIDYELEMATIIGLFVGIPLLAPRYHAALKKVEARKEVVKADYLNRERRWRRDTKDAIKVKYAAVDAAD